MLIVNLFSKFNSIFPAFPKKDLSNSRVEFERYGLLQGELFRNIEMFKRIIGEKIEVQDSKVIIRVEVSKTLAVHKEDFLRRCAAVCDQSIDLDDQLPMAPQVESLKNPNLMATKRRKRELYNDFKLDEECGLLEIDGISYTVASRHKPILKRLYIEYVEHHRGCHKDDLREAAGIKHNKEFSQIIRSNVQ